MAKAKRPLRVKYRRAVQLFFAALSNSYVTGFAAGKIYQGSLKSVCAPGLNCYSCPGALLSCPIGSLQAVLGSRAFTLSTYVFGMVLFFGAVMGRMVCGFLCPFGLVQELLYKIPFVKKVRTFKGDKQLRYLKYVLLAVLVILLPMMVGMKGDAPPYFCKYVCPAGSLEAGIPHVLYDRLGPKNVAAENPASTGLAPLPGLNIAAITQNVLPEANRLRVGFLYWWKIGILAIVVLLSIILYRPFCKYLCPLGAFYGLLNPIALYRLRFNESACIKCGACKRACGMCLDPTKQVNHAECVRCGDCVNVCPTAALSMGFTEKKDIERVREAAQIEGPNGGKETR